MSSATLRYSWNQKQKDLAANLLQELEYANLEARALYSGYSPFLATESAVKAISGAIDASSAAIAKLREQFNMQTLTFANWRISADAQYSFYSGKGNIFETMDSGAYTFSRFWQEVVTPTASDVETVAKETADKAESGFPFAVVALVAIAVIVVFK